MQGPWLDVTSPDGWRRFVPIMESPFFIGRGGETGNHLQLEDRRISRHCSAIISEGNHVCLEDRGHRHGIFVNGEKIERCILEDGDSISFGLDESYEIVFRATDAVVAIQDLLTRIESVSGTDPAPGGFRRLNLLLEATSLLQSQLPLDSVLGTMIDHAILITGAERGLLLEGDSADLHVRLARGKERVQLSPGDMTPSQTALRLALQQQSSVVTKDLSRGESELQSAESVVAQQLRAVVAIPLYAVPRASSTATTASRHGNLLGVIYLDSRRPAAFSKLDHQILDALAWEAASLLDHARLVERERQRQRLEQELSIARDIQQALLPGGFRDFRHLSAAGFNSPCLAVGGDYFDVFQMADESTAFLIADVSGKGLGAALLTTMLQGALFSMTNGGDSQRVFTSINRFLCEHPEVDRYATMFFGTLTAAGRLDFLNAGHPSPLLLRRGEVTQPFTEASFPLGLFPEADYLTAHLELEPGDTLVLFSDGVTEAMDPNEQMFGVSRLREVLAGQESAPIDRLQNAIFESVREFTCGASQADDITILLVRYRAAAEGAAA